jgi:hypothetical protein
MTRLVSNVDVRAIDMPVEISVFHGLRFSSRRAGARTSCAATKRIRSFQCDGVRRPSEIRRSRVSVARVSNSCAAVPVDGLVDYDSGLAAQEALPNRRNRVDARSLSALCHSYSCAVPQSQG